VLPLISFTAANDFLMARVSSLDKWSLIRMFRLLLRMGELVM
jgi:hypothetical protein